jgi:hypothetical protein
MAALTEGRVTARKLLQRQTADKVKAATKIFGGSIVCGDANGWAVPGADTANFKTFGVAVETADNTAVGAANGDVSVRCQRGVFKFDNGAGGNALAQADVGKTCFVVDDHTVGKATAQSIAAGILDSIDPDGGIWVAIL